MQANEQKKLTSFLRNEDGIMAVVFALCLPVFVVIAALAIDMGYSYWKRNALQVDSSLTSLAGAGYVLDDATVTKSGIWKYDLVDKDLDGLPDNDDSDADGVPDGAAVLLEAIYYSNENIDPAENALAVEDVMPGHWDPATRIFTRAGTWDPLTLMFTKDPAEYDTTTDTWTDVADQIAPFDAVIAFTRRADDGPNNNPLPLFLAAAVGMPAVNINTAAIAAIAPEIGEPTACILALDPDDENALHIFGTAELHAEDCDIVVNSCDDKAIWFNGTPDIYVAVEEGAEGGSIASCGGYQENGPVTVVGDMVLDDPTVIQDDPVLLTAPVLADDGSECDYTDFRWPQDADPDNGLVLKPGVYCGGIKGTSVGEMTFCGQDITVPGCAAVNASGDSLYIMKDGPLEIAGGSGVTAEGVTFYLTDDAGGPYSLVDFKGTSSTFLDMSAPTEGDYAGVLFWHDCGGTDEECAALTHNLRGTPGYGMEGLLYFPDSHVYVRGTADAGGGSDDCLMLVANTIEMNGTSGLNVDNACSNYGGLDDIFVADLRLRLVH